jgi:prepilin-type N-terminal cleavage/methylation domain-containing protein
MMTLAHSVHPRKQPGFSMVELITVMIVIGIMAAVAAATHEFFQSSTQRATATR